MDTILERVYGNSPGAVFRFYIASVLVIFALLSFASVPVCDDFDMIFQSSWWWGVISLFGAGSMFLRSKIVSWKLGAWIGDLSSITAFLFLTYDYMTRKPPIFSGGILAATAVIFLLGGLRYDRRA